MLHVLLETLHDPAVRDLAWVIGSPGLVDAAYPPYQNRVVNDSWCTAQLQQYTSWLIALDQSPLPLHDFIATHPTRRLGHYFETLIAYWLTHQEDVEIIATNLQVQQQQKTLGEYDFIFRNADAEVCHWEAAVKFYLQQDPISEQHAFIGPGTRDRLDLKLAKVFQQQLHLGDSAAGQQALPHGITIDKSQAFIKGYLFYHAATPRNSSIAGISAAHLDGWWARHNIDEIPQASAESHWIIPLRLSWLAPVLATANEAVFNSRTLQQHLALHFATLNEALLIIELIPTDTGKYREISRGFVVCKTWPTIPSTILTS